MTVYLAGSRAGLRSRVARVVALALLVGQAACSSSKSSAPAAAKPGEVTLESIAVRPKSASGTNPGSTSVTIALGQTMNFVAMGRFSDGSESDITESAEWISNDPKIASVSNAEGTRGQLSAIAEGVIQLRARDSESGIESPSIRVLVVPATLVSISITPGIPQPLPVGRTEQFRATGTFSDHSTRDLTEHIEWSSSAATIVEVSTTDGSRGLATGLRVGTARIRARDPSSGLVAQEIELRVTAAVLESIEVTASSSASLPVGRTRRLTATGRFSDASARVLTNVVDWESSDDAIATVSSGPGERGIVTGEAVGTAQITAVDAATGIASAPFPIQVSAAVLATIDVTPASLPPLAKGRKVTFKAAGTFSDGTTDDDISDSVEWSSLEPSVASISNDAGTIGVATALAKGTTMITARDPASGVTSPAVTLQVTDAVLESISISSSTSGPLAKGRGRQFEATGLFSDGSTLSMTSAVTWNSSDPNVADISNAAGSEGLASARMIGVTKISAVDPITHVGSAEIELTVTEAVLDAIDIEPSGISGLPVGRTQALRAIGVFSDKTTQDLTDLVSWTSGVPAIATVSNAPGAKGVVSGMSAGQTTIHATDPATMIESATIDVEVTDAVLVSLAIEPSSPPDLPVGRTQSLTAIGTFSDNSTADLTASVTWETIPLEIATVSNAAGSKGIVTGQGVGEAIVTASVPGTMIDASVTITVTDAVLVSLAIEPGQPAPIPEGQELSLRAFGTYSDGSVLELTETAAWSTDDGSVATVSNATGSRGRVRAEGVGEATIEAKIVLPGGDPQDDTSIVASVRITVTDAVLVSLAIDPSDPQQLPDGRTLALKAIGTFSDDTTQDLTANVTWVSSDPNVATVSNAAGAKGVVTGSNPGDAEIHASDTATGIDSPAVSITVTDAVLESLAIEPSSPPDLPVGKSQAFQAIGTFSDDTIQDLTASVTWVSLQESVATVSNAAGSKGVATAHAPGRADIKASTTFGEPGSEVTINANAVRLTVTDAVLDSIVLTPSDDVSVPEGRSVSVQATGVYSDETEQDLTASATWSSSAPEIASVSNLPGSKGIVSALEVGTAEIVASEGGIQSPPLRVQVTAAVLESLTIAPDPAGPVAKGGAVQFSAKGTFSDGSEADLTSTVTWESSSAAVGISNAAGSKGRATGLAIGTALISAVDPSTAIRSQSVTLEVTDAVLTSIAIEPAGPLDLAVSSTVALKANGTFSDLSVRDITSTVTWISNAPLTVNVSNAAGTKGQATGLVAGEALVRARDVATGIEASPIAITVFDEDRMYFGEMSLPAGGQDQSISIRLDNRQTARGFSCGVRYDPAALNLVKVERNGSVAQTADFFVVNTDPDDGLVAIGCIFDAANDPSRDLLPARGHVLSFLIFDVLAAAGSVTDIELDEVQANPSAPPTKNVYTNLAGASVTPRTIDARVRIEP